LLPPSFPCPRFLLPPSLSLLFLAPPPLELPSFPRPLLLLRLLLLRGEAAGAQADA